MVLSLLISLASNLKIKFLGEPLLPWDFSLSKETTNIINYFVVNINFGIIALLVISLVGFIYICKYIRKKDFGKEDPKIRLVLAMLSLAFLGSIYFGIPVPAKQDMINQCITWDQHLNYEQNGFLLAFTMNFEWLTVKKPDDYNQKRIETIVNGITQKTDKNNTVQPNIIIIQSEAFWDPTALKEVSFSKDPIPFFHSLQKKYTSGSLLVPVYGGATVDTEFEVLTGNSMQFFSGGIVPYSQYLRKPTESLASILSEQGYTATAIHTYENWFYRRDEVFKNLGFNNFISNEFFVNPVTKRYYTTDSELSQKIIDAANKGNEPKFIFAITMQNHGPYVIGYDKQDIHVNGNISPEGKSILDIYSQGLADTDKALQKLVNYFKKSKQPTIIVYYGDHLPALGEDYLVYKEANYFKDDGSFSEYKKMHSTPFVIWSNYLTPPKDFTLNSSFIGSYVLNLAGLHGSLYTDFLASLSKVSPLLPTYNYFKEAGVKEDLVEDYQLLQYDHLFGEGYQYKGKIPDIINKNYFLGSGKMVIKDAVITEDNKSKTGAVLTLTGENFVPTGKNFLPKAEILINGTSHEVDFIDEKHISTPITVGMAHSHTPFDIQVKLQDSMKSVIAESNCLKYDKMLK
jgi:phosphoglycerol transferase MdoB-like AlkP superfamily enzyme